MELVNSTFLTASLGVGEMPESDRRMGVLAAKATFRIGNDGQCDPDMDDPYPMFQNDEETPLGLLPRDDLPKGKNTDVIALGCAYPPGGRPATRATVSVQVGTVKRSLAVIGNRFWQNGKMSDPEPFEKMPITYANAFGGKAEVEIDQGSFITLADPGNPDGKGFHVDAMIPSIDSQFKTPEGYPRFSEIRPLPNIEDPDHLISSPDDAPAPAYWATVPMSTAIHAFRAMGLNERDLKDPDIMTNKPDIAPTSKLWHRAHPSLDLDLQLTPGMDVVLEGLTPEGLLQFTVPGWEIGADLLLNEKWVEVKLRADTLVLLPEEKRFYIVYRFNFTYEYVPGTERTVRLICREWN
ncbi:MAG: DUF2169 domain-containing protein [Desulfosalsimonadaceae bacterium]